MPLAVVQKRKEHFGLQTERNGRADEVKLVINFACNTFKW
jgi:hypothetical protein